MMPQYIAITEQQTSKSCEICFAGFLAIMFGLIMRVLKNVFEKAVEIKSENDFTV